jgi:hypothetical protein
MNQKRIMELWDKANFLYYQSESDQPLPQFIFAELIVKECAIFIENDDYRGLTLSDRLKTTFWS